MPDRISAAFAGTSSVPVPASNTDPALGEWAPIRSSLIKYFWVNQGKSLSVNLIRDPVRDPSRLPTYFFKIKIYKRKGLEISQEL